MPEAVPGGGGGGGAMGVLTKKVGPLPVWGYAAIAGGGLLALRLIHPGASSSSGGGVALGPVPVAAGGAPAGSGGDFAPPAVTGPRTSPPAQDVVAQSVPVPALLPPAVAGGPLPNASIGGDLGNPYTLPSPRDLVPTAPVQPPLYETVVSAPSGPGGSFVGPSGVPQATNLPGGAKVQVIGGTQYSLSDAAVARGGVTDFAQMRATPLVSPTGPTVSVANEPPARQPTPGAPYYGPGGVNAPPGVAFSV